MYISFSRIQENEKENSLQNLSSAHEASEKAEAYISDIPFPFLLDSALHSRQHSTLDTDPSLEHIGRAQHLRLE
jgi:hypothetical protein